MLGWLLLSRSYSLRKSAFSSLLSAADRYELYSHGSPVSKKNKHHDDDKDKDHDDRRMLF